MIFKIFILFFIITGAIFSFYCIFLHGHRLLSGLIDNACSSLGLTKAKISSSIWQVNRNSFRFSSQPVAQGQWQSIPVEIAFYPKGFSIEGASITSVTLLWIGKIAHAGIDRYATLDEPNNLIDSFPIIGQPITGTDMRRINDPWFGPSIVWGSDAELDRVFSPVIREMLKAFPRRLAVIFYEDQVMVIKWFALEKDPLIIEQAFKLGINILETLSPR